MIQLLNIGTYYTGKFCLCSVTFCFVCIYFPCVRHERFPVQEYVAISCFFSIPSSQFCFSFWSLKHLKMIIYFLFQTHTQTEYFYKHRVIHIRFYYFAPNPLHRQQNVYNSKYFVAITLVSSSTIIMLRLMVSHYYYIILNSKFLVHNESISFVKVLVIAVFVSDHKLFLTLGR